MAQKARAEECLDPTSLERLQRQKLANLLSEMLRTNTFYRPKLDGLAFDPLSDPLDRLPLTTRADLQQDQLDHPPYGSNLTFPVGDYVRLHQTSGSTGLPLRWLDTAESWQWCKRCWASIYRAAGLTSQDRLIFPFSFGPFLGFWCGFESAVDLGNLCLPAGGMTTSARLHYLVDNAVTFVCCTPTYALRMAEVAATEGIDLRASAVRGLIVAGEPGGNIPATRARIESCWGSRVFDHIGMTEIGPWGFECLESPGGVHVNECEYIAEVIDADTAKPVTDGGPGELVLTNLGRTASPLIRYRTGDQVRLSRDRCPCGRWFLRAEGGILGRIDDMLVIRGNNVFPSALEGIVLEFDEVAEFSMELDEQGSMTELHIALEPRTLASRGFQPARTSAQAKARGSQFADPTGLSKRVTNAIRDRLHFTPRVTLVKPGSLPRFEMKANRVVRRREN